MAEVDIAIAGRSYALACRDGEEEHLRAIAAMVDAKARDAVKAMGGMSESRQLLLAALLMADELNDLKAGSGSDPAAVAAFEKLAQRIETFADRLENADATA